MPPFLPAPLRTGRDTFASSGSPVPVLRMVQAIGITPTRTPLLAGKPASLRPGVGRPLETAFPSSDSYGRSGTLGLAPHRPSRSASTPHVYA